MYTQIRNPSVTVYDFKTDKYLGEARFKPTLSAEKSLLDWINYGISPRSLVMVESSFQPSENYVPIVPNETYHQRGIFKAVVKDGNSGKWVPAEANITYDWRSRSPEPGNYLSSVEFSNVKTNGAFN
ncbi:MAG TPA: hypothetical protein VN626_08020, partial [Clostridia bacterium]|nr:hypothetical protein [Clostridia bacterium]